MEGVTPQEEGKTGNSDVSPCWYLHENCFCRNQLNHTNGSIAEKKGFNPL